MLQNGGCSAPGNAPVGSVYLENDQQSGHLGDLLTWSLSIWAKSTLERARGFSGPGRDKEFLPAKSNKVITAVSIYTMIPRKTELSVLVCRKHNLVQGQYILEVG